MAITSDPTDPRLGHGVDSEPRPQQEVYLVLSDDERAKGFVRPLRYSYRHIGKAPKYPLRDLTENEKLSHEQWGYVKFEVYPESESPKTGRFWTQAQLDNINGCGTITSMGQAIAETYARDPHFYGSTYCVHCRKHLPLEEFVWEDDGTPVGS